MLLASCENSGTGITAETPTDGLCAGTGTPLSTIQGNGYTSPLEGTSLTTGGVVTRVLDNGDFFIEDTAPVRRGHSRALLVLAANFAAPVNTGQQLRLNGTVTETGNARDTVTALTAISAFSVCADSVGLPLTEVVLPLNNRQREALESMRLSFSQSLTVTDNYALSRGELGLSSGGRLWSPTERAEPGKEALRLGRENGQRRVAARLPVAAPGQPLPTGIEWNGARGILGHDGRYPLFLLETPVPGDDTGVHEHPPAAIGQLRVVSLNLRNFFNGDGLGGGFPAARGARTARQFEQQKQRLGAAFTVLSPGLLGVQELENDGFGPRSAALELLELLEQATGRQFAVARLPAGRVGNDEIAVGLFYDRSLLEPLGPAATLRAAPFDGLSRQPLAQAFRERTSGKRILVAVNHLKSKGGCPDTGKNARQGDGQGCWNAARTAAVHAQVGWLNELAAQSKTDRIVVMGDLNAYRREDPVRAFVAAGFTDLVEQLNSAPSHTYVYRGEAGTLDYVLASPELSPAARQAGVWHVNADWPEKFPMPRPWLRMSDHDPVVVDLELSQAETSD